MPGKVNKYQRIAIVGAGGDVGKLAAEAIAASKLLRRGGELVLVGRTGGKSQFVVAGLKEDLGEALYDRQISLIATTDAEQAFGDAVIFAASVPDPPLYTKVFAREDLAEGNCRLFHEFAPIFVRLKDRIGCLLVLSNPVELGVRLFGEAIGKEKVLGLGAMVDSLRFRYELASQLDVPGKQVFALAGGEHGSDMVFFWSTVRVKGKPLPMERVRQLSSPDWKRLKVEYHRAYRKACQLVETEGIAAAYEFLKQQTLDVRVMVKSYITHTSGGKTANVASRATLELLTALNNSSPALCAAQVFSEFGIIGVPLEVSQEGWKVNTDILSRDEREALRFAGQRVEEKHKHIMAVAREGKAPEPPLRYKVLLCPPTYFHPQRVEFSINPHTHINAAVDNEKLTAQFERLVDAIRKLDVADVDFIPPGENLRLMTYAANGGAVFEREGSKPIAVVASFTFPERRGESEHYERWFKEHGYHVLKLPPGLFLEGEGDLLRVPDTNTWFCGYGLRSDEEAVKWLEETLRAEGLDVHLIPIPNTDPYFYHLDTYACFLGRSPKTGMQTAMLHPPATTPLGIRRIFDVCPDIIEVRREEAMCFPCNALVFGTTVLMPWCNERLLEELDVRGFQVEVVEVGEFMKAGGQVKCMAMMLQHGLPHPPLSPSPRPPLPLGEGLGMRRLLASKALRMLGAWAFHDDLVAIARQIVRGRGLQHRTVARCTAYVLMRLGRLPQRAREAAQILRQTNCPQCQDYGFRLIEASEQLSRISYSVQSLAQASQAKALPLPVHWMVLGLQECAKAMLEPITSSAQILPLRAAYAWLEHQLQTLQDLEGHRYLLDNYLSAVRDHMQGVQTILKVAEWLAGHRHGARGQGHGARGKGQGTRDMLHRARVILRGCRDILGRIEEAAMGLMKMLEGWKA